jgi:hypothetical protein
MGFPFTYSHSVDRPRDPFTPPADTAAVLAALARELKRREASFVQVQGDVLTFYIWWWAGSNAVRHVHRGSIRAEAGEQGLVLRYEIDVGRCVVGFWLLAVVVFSLFFRPTGWGVPGLVAFCAILPSFMYLVQPLFFKRMLRNVPLSGYMRR